MDLNYSVRKALSDITPGREKESGLKTESVVDLGSIIVTISKTRLGNKCGQLSKRKMAEVDVAICVSLEIERDS
jgi:mRNA-degrading endonuclease toxin of MazEF toxin-antitoxin module